MRTSGTPAPLESTNVPERWARENRIAPQGQNRARKEKNEEMENGESLVSFYPPLLHAWELEGRPMGLEHHTAASFAGLLAWRVNLAG